ncbi:hypothetical protein [Halarsenatibacter silvermanii]|uniref:Uncharacterized protein n=1 Tax=Halarsenatibacter silvermanii TaxID=321763 RepID=A0A1G9LDD1_9FIRM|nr:hypothetical protein [Halarsenatibacter silvermanii]SDL59856.1 hypothetical protein SAMN04488692_10627 [Halarsenatibacter silvermanii]
MKKSSLIILLLITALTLTSCYETGVKMDFDSDGEMDLKINVEGDEDIASDDVNMVYWQLLTAFPEIDINYHSYKEDRDLKFERLKSISHEKIDHITFEKKNGRYEFEMELPPIYSELDESDDLFLNVIVTLPGEIDTANTINVEGNQSEWDLRIRDIHQSIKLEAVTE